MLEIRQSPSRFIRGMTGWMGLRLFDDFFFFFFALLCLYETWSCVYVKIYRKEKEYRDMGTPNSLDLYTSCILYSK
jgi:hypothetical protein